MNLNRPCRKTLIAPRRQSPSRPPPFVAIALLAYIPAMRGGFLWDDYTFLMDNSLIQAPDGLQRFWFTTQAEDYFPLTSSTLWVEWRLWGDHAAGYHVINVLLHAAARGAALAGAAAARRSRRVAGGSSLRRSPGRGGVGGVDHGTEEHAVDGALSPVAPGLSPLRRARRAARVSTSRSPWFLLALLAKTSVVMLPVVLLLCAWWRRGKIARKDLLRSLPFFALALALGLVTVWFQQHNVIRQRDRPARGMGFARGRDGMDRLVLPVQGPRSRGALRRLSALGRQRREPCRVPAAGAASPSASLSSGRAARVGAGRRCSRWDTSSSCCCRFSASRTCRS